MADATPTTPPTTRPTTAAFAALVDGSTPAMRTAFATVPPEHRKLLTYHDAYAYFGRDYGWTVIGAIQVADFEEPTPKEVADLIDQVRATGCRRSSGRRSSRARCWSRSGARPACDYVDALRDDDLPGAPGDPEHSYLGLMRFDFVTMIEALGGDAAALGPSTSAAGARQRGVPAMTAP